MMKINVRYIASMAALVALPAVAQDINTAYFDEGFLYQHSLNPAAGNEQNYIALPIIGNMNIKMMGDFGYNDVVRKNPLYPAMSDKKMTSFLNPYLNDALDGFNTGDNRISGQAKVAVLSAGFKGLGGYNTLELNVRAKINGVIPYELLRMACDLKNEHYDIGTVRADGIAFSELAFGHSRDINDKLRLGAKLKLLLGIGNASLKMDNVQAAAPRSMTFVRENISM